MKLTKGSQILLIVFLALYIVSPLDFFPGVHIDDLAALIGLIAAWKAPALTDNDSDCYDDCYMYC